MPGPPPSQPRVLAAVRSLLPLSLLLAACSAPAEGSSPSPPPAAASAPASAASPAAPACAARIAEASARPAGKGAPAFDAARAEFLGRARSEPMVFVHEPTASSAALPVALQDARQRLDKGPPGVRVTQVVKRHERDPAALRALLLRDGYVYAPDPHDALALATLLHVGDLFDAPEVWLQRGAQLSRLELQRTRGARVYRHADGPSQGQTAELLFGDRVAASRQELDKPLHRDLRALAEAEGFDRARIVHRGDDALVAELRFGATWARALLPSRGAELSLGCLDGSAEELARVEEHRRDSLPRRQALGRLSRSVTELVGEALRFDRPEGEKTAERDGQLRPAWFDAYQRGAQSFAFDGHSYPVHDPSGRAWPPEVCVDFVLDSFERASGTWFTPRGEPPARVVGKVDFDAYGIKNRRAVLAFEKFAASQPELFDVRRFRDQERIAFEHRSRFFQFLVDNADDFRPGDVLAIHGLKRDGLIHQHAILLERTDPVSGFPYGLADQMKRPRRRTWEGIMAEAPRRSLLYRIHPGDRVFGQ